jgi:MFS family permease
MFLVGYVFGPMAWGPLSESYGRKGTMVYSFAILTIFSIASAVAPNFAALVVFRLLVGIGGSCAISVVGGICADIWHDPISRGRSMAIFMVCTIVSTIGIEADKLIGCDYVRTYSWTRCVRLYICGLMELGFLGRGDPRRCNLAAILVLPRDVRAADLEEESPALAERDGRRDYCCTA